MRKLRTLHMLIYCLLWALTAGCAKEKTASPTETVRTFHQLAEKGDWVPALALVDLDSKCRAMLGDLYASGSLEDQKAMREIWARRLQLSTQTYLDKHFGDSLGKLSESQGQDGQVEVHQRKANFLLVYTLAETDGQWRIVDRIHEKDGVRPDPSRALRVILSRIEKELGRKPTLAEVNARLESYMDRLKVRTINVR